MQQHERTPAYWPARIMLSLGVMGTVLAVGFAIMMAFPPPLLGGDPSFATIGPLTMPTAVVSSLVAGAMAIVGLAWQVRIFRGERHQAPAWRYRDR